MSEPKADELQREWERRLPDLDDEWTHWWLEGDGALLSVIVGSDLRSALELVRANRSQYSAIMAYRAKIDPSGQPTRDKKRRWEISNRAKEPPAN